MPCYSIQTNQVKMNFTNVDILEKALIAEGYTVHRIGDELRFDGHVWAQGQLTYRVTAGPEIASRINRAYSKQVVKQTAMKMGWRLEMKSSTQFVAQRGSR